MSFCKMLSIESKNYILRILVIFLIPIKLVLNTFCILSGIDIAAKKNPALGHIF